MRPVDFGRPDLAFYWPYSSHYPLMISTDQMDAASRLLWGFSLNGFSEVEAEASPMSDRFERMDWNW